MKIKFVKNHLSISRFDEIEIPDFTILTGKNGSGKSHLLQSIINGSSKIDNIPVTEITLFDYKTFFIDNEPQFTDQQIIQERTAAWAKFNSNAAPAYKVYFQRLKNNLTHENYLELLKIADGKPFLKINSNKISEPKLLEAYKNYKSEVRNFFNSQSIKSTPEGRAFKSMINRIPGTLEELTEESFYELYTPVNLKNDFLPIQLGKSFLDYWFKYQAFVVREIQNQKEYNEEAFRKQFEDIHGPRPWILIEKILENFSSFDYTINNPESLVLDPYKPQSFVLTLNHRTKGIQVPFSNLSSGEKILFCIVLSMYKSAGDGLFPSVLLLDEIDASLHPSQIQNLLNAINQNFVTENNVKVILASHSISTIALAEEKNIFVVNKSGTNRIEKQTKKEGINILSEGFITLDQGIQIFDQFSKKDLTIFTEGNNISFLKKAIRLYIPELSNRIDIVENLKNRTGKNQLNTLYDFFLRMPHDNKILMVYDCDVKTILEEKNKTFYFTFPFNEQNKKVLKGIENLFPVKFFKDEFYAVRSKEDGGMHSSLDKPKFEEYVLRVGKKPDFKNFISFIDKIKLILKK